MARAMTIRSVAGGIEDADMLEMLRALGCEEIQGTCVAPGMKPREFEEWMSRGGAHHLDNTLTTEARIQTEPTVDIRLGSAQWSRN
jgi:predicted signal transduction protein with EAL and GGDEF domain